MLLVMPLLIPLTTAVGCLLAWRWRSVQRALAVVGAVGLFVTGPALLWRVDRYGIQTVQIGSWPAPFGITLVADLFSAIMVLLTGLMALTVVVYSLFSLDRGRESFGYYALLQVLLMGVCGAFLTGDIFNMYVWFEVMLIASFVLLALGGERPQMEGALKYVTLNLISSAMFLAAVGILYGMTGTLNMADLSEKLAAVDEPGLVTTLAMLFLVAFGIKSAAFPLFFWLPASYHTPPAAVSAIFSALLTKVGVYALIRIFTLLFIAETAFTHNLILLIAGLTMVTGVLGAAAQSDFRRILSFHIVSQIGYVLMGLGLFTPLALAGAIFFIMHQIIVKTNLFLISGVAERIYGTSALKRLGGFYRDFPAVAILFLIPAFSLAGAPPLSGFVAKLALVKAGLEIEQYAIVAVALGVSLLTLFSMTKIWAEAFWRPVDANLSETPEADSAAADAVDPGDAPRSQTHPAGYKPLLFPIAALATLTIVVGIAGEPIFTLTERAAEQLLDTSAYIQAVLGSRP